MAIAEIKWKLVKDTYFFDTTTCYLSEDGNHMFYSGGEKRIKILIDDLNELVRKGCAMWLELGEYEFGLDKLSKCPTQTWYSIHQMLYSLEPWGVIKESKKSVRKSIEESKTMTFEEFKKLCNDNFGYAIMDFNEYKGAYIVVVSSNEKATELFTKALTKKGLECTFYELRNPNSEYYRCYEIMCV